MGWQTYNGYVDRFGHRIRITTGDERQRLAESFNAIATELAVSQDRRERIAKLKRFLAPQVAELVDQVGDDSCWKANVPRS